MILDITTTWRTYLQDANQIAQIIGTVLVIVYVIYTYKTFLQIKKQTDYMHDAYLRIESSILKEIVQDAQSSILELRRPKQKIKLPTKYLNKDIPAKMTEVLKPIFKFDDDLFEGNYFTIGFTNYGNAEVNLIKLSITIVITNSKEVANKKMLKLKEIHNFEIQISEIVSRNGGELRVPIVSTASFPMYEIIVKGTYSDIRNKQYQIQEFVKNGQNEHFFLCP